MSYNEPMLINERDTKDRSSYTEEPEGWVIYIRLKKPEDDPGDDLGYETSRKGEDLSRVPKEYRTFTVFRYKIKNELL
jgi:hypothetical protein